MVVHAIIENEGYIFTHYELEETLDKRFEGVSRFLEKWLDYNKDNQL